MFRCGRPQKLPHLITFYEKFWRLGKTKYRPSSRKSCLGLADYMVDVHSVAFRQTLCVSVAVLGFLIGHGVKRTSVAFVTRRHSLPRSAVKWFVKLRPTEKLTSALVSKSKENSDHWHSALNFGPFWSASCAQEQSISRGYICFDQSLSLRHSLLKLKECIQNVPIRNKCRSITWLAT